VKRFRVTGTVATEKKPITVTIKAGTSEEAESKALEWYKFDSLSSVNEEGTFKSKKVLGFINEKSKHVSKPTSHSRKVRGRIFFK
jgi:hypothetical protein